MCDASTSGCPSWLLLWRKMGDIESRCVCSWCRCVWLAILLAHCRAIPPGDNWPKGNCCLRTYPQKERQLPAFPAGIHIHISQPWLADSDGDKTQRWEETRASMHWESLLHLKPYPYKIYPFPTLHILTTLQYCLEFINSIVLWVYHSTHPPPTLSPWSWEGEDTLRKERKTGVPRGVLGMVKVLSWPASSL